MAFTRFSARTDTIVSNDNSNQLCQNTPLLQCTEAIRAVIWAALLFAVIIFVWKIGVCPCRKKTSTGKSNSKEDHPLPLPYLQPLPEIYEDVSKKELGSDSSTSTLVDPYLIANSFDNSLISKDDSFKRMEMPEPVLKWRESVNHSALDFPEAMVIHPLQLDPTNQLHDDDDKKSITYLRPATPPPVYVRSPHS